MLQQFGESQAAGESAEKEVEEVELDMSVCEGGETQHGTWEEVDGEEEVDFDDLKKTAARANIGWKVRYS